MFGLRAKEDDCYGRTMPAPHRILLLAFPNGQLLDMAGPLQMFAGANPRGMQGYAVGR